MPAAHSTAPSTLPKYATAPAAAGATQRGVNVALVAVSHFDVAAGRFYGRRPGLLAKCLQSEWVMAACVAGIAA